MSTRPPFRRMQLIFFRINEGNFPSRTILARELEVTVKTIQRDLDFMGDQMGVPIEYVPHKFGYRFSEPVESFPNIPISQSELISLLVAQKALVQYRGTPFEEPLRQTFQKLCSGLEGALAVSWTELDEALSFRSLEVRPAQTRLFADATQAVQEHREIAFNYRKINMAAHQLRRVRPYHIACVSGQWYLLGHDIAGGRIRTYALSRMRELRMTDRTFTKPKDFSVSNLLKNSFSVFEGSHVYPVKIRFNAYAAQFIRERVWHRSQKIKELPDLGLELSLKLSSLVEIEPWILSWGSHAEVLGPPDLIQRVSNTLRMAVGRYTQKGDGF